MTYTNSNIQTQQSLGNIKLSTVVDDDNEHIQRIALTDVNNLLTSTLSGLGGLIDTDVSDESMLVAVFSGTFSLQATFWASADGVTFVPIFGIKSDTGVASVGTGALAANAAYQFNVAGFKKFRMICSSYTSGAATVALSSSTLSSGIYNPPPLTIGAGPNSAANRAFVQNVPSSLCVYAEGVSGAAVTLTLPAVTSQYHYIDTLKIVAYYAAAVAASATPITVTTTNMIGTPKFYLPTGLNQGEVVRLEPFSGGGYIRSNAVTTATTVVMPATPGILWSALCAYTTSAGL